MPAVLPASNQRHFFMDAKGSEEPKHDKRVLPSNCMTCIQGFIWLSLSDPHQDAMYSFYEAMREGSMFSNRDLPSAEGPVIAQGCSWHAT